MPIASFQERTLPPFSVPLVAGRLYGTPVALGGLTTVAIAANTLYAVPFKVEQRVTLVVIGVEITSATAGNFRLGIYNDSNGVPGSLKHDAGAVAMGAAAGFKSITISVTLDPGWYWLAAVADAAPTCRASNATNARHDLGFASGTATTVAILWSVAFTYAALPDPFTGGGALATTNPLRILIGP